MVYDLITSRHRLQLVGSGGERTTFSDYEETEDSEAQLRGFLRTLEQQDRRESSRIKDHGHERGPREEGCLEATPRPAWAAALAG